MAGLVTRSQTQAAPSNRAASLANFLALIGRTAAVCALPIIVGLWTAATAFVGGTFLPWRPLMVDLDVYRRAGAALLQGSDFYELPGPLPRSEEHTSELQSRQYLVCRLLLEKKKQ